MAATYAFCRGIDASRIKEVHRLGAQRAEAGAQTYRTFARVGVARDGRTWIEVRRDDALIHTWECGPEAAEGTAPSADEEATT